LTIDGELSVHIFMCEEVFFIRISGDFSEYDQNKDSIGTPERIDSAPISCFGLVLPDPHQ